MPSEINDLVGRCLSGDAAAVGQFVEQFQQIVYARCVRLLGDRHDAEDATQETLLRALRSLHRWNPRRPLLPWLLAIASNRCRTMGAQRRQRPGTRAPLHDIPQPELSDGATLAEELQSAIDQLREDYQTVFHLFYRQELSCTEIGLLLGVPEGTVKTWLHRARRELADRLRRRGVVSEDGHELHRL